MCSFESTRVKEFTIINRHLTVWLGVFLRIMEIYLYRLTLHIFIAKMKLFTDMKIRRSLVEWR